jgi:hypothetical protein
MSKMIIFIDMKQVIRFTTGAGVNLFDIAYFGPCRFGSIL